MLHVGNLILNGYIRGENRGQQWRFYVNFLKVTASAPAIFRWENNRNSGGGIPIKQKTFTS